MVTRISIDSEGAGKGNRVQSYLMFPGDISSHAGDSDCLLLDHHWRMFLFADEAGRERPLYLTPNQLSLPSLHHDVCLHIFVKNVS